MYKLFGFTFSIRLATRPDKYVGDDKTWSQAEQQLQETLSSGGYEYSLDPGGGAFYGPKIDVAVSQLWTRCLTDTLRLLLTHTPFLLALCLSIICCCCCGHCR